MEQILSQIAIMLILAFVYLPYVILPCLALLIIFKTIQTFLDFFH